MKVKAILLVALALTVLGTASVSAAPKTITVGLSWNEKSHSLIQAWQDYMKAYSDEVGAKSGIKFTWIVNVADSDPSQQASNI